MLCHLAGPARIRTILTTNFDTLIEDAFAELHQRFEVISVGLKGALPHPDTVHSLNSVIKLRGSVVDTRADFSLNDPPSEEDKRRFYNYARGGDAFTRGAGFRPGHLLVMGYSGSDIRCVQMIKFVLDLDPDTRVYWVCFSKQSKDALMTEVFPEPEYREKIYRVLSRKPDMLLYELYQQLTLCLPGGGFTYQLSPNMPFSSDYGEANYARPNRAVEESDAAKICKEIGETGKPAHFVIVDNASGTSAPLRRAFDNATQGLVRTAIWLELEDHFGIPHVAYEILQIIAVRIGRFQLDHATLLPVQEVGHQEANERAIQWDIHFWRNHCRLLFDTWGFKPESCLIVLYGRNGPGGCVGFKQRYWQTGAEPTMTRFLECLTELGFRMVYAPYSKRRFTRDLRKEEAVDERAKALRPAKEAKRYFVEETAAKEREKKEKTGEDHNVMPDCRVSKWRSDRPESVRDPVLQVESFDSTEPTGSEQSQKSVFINCEYDQRRRFEEILDDLRRNWLEAGPAQLKSAPDRMQSTFNRRNFLYGCTLFRQSRHYASFFYRCGDGLSLPVQC